MACIDKQREMDNKRKEELLLKQKKMENDDGSGCGIM